MAQVDNIAQIAAPENSSGNWRAYQVSNKPEIVAILTCASQNYRRCAGQPEQLTMPALPGSEVLPARAGRAGRSAVWRPATKRREWQAPTPAIVHFMEHGMDALLDADTLLQQWHNANDRSVL